MPKPLRAQTQALLWQLIRPYRWQLLAGSFMLVVSAAAMLALPQFLKQMFDAALHSGNAGQLAYLAAMMFATVLVMVGSIFLRTRLIANSGNNLLATLRNQLSEHLLNQDTAFFETRASGAIVSRLTADPFALREFLNLAAPQLVRGLVLGFGTLCVLLYTSPSLTLLLLLAAAPIGIAGKIIGQKIRVTARKVQDNLALYGAQIEETVTNIRTIHAFSQQPRLLAVFEEQANEITRIANHRALLSAAFVATNVVIGFSALIGVVWLGGLRVMHGQMSLGDMMAFLLYLAFLADAVGNITNFWPAWQATLGATERIIELLGQRPAITNPAPSHTSSLAPAHGGRSITLHNVAYAYPSRPENAALANLTTTIPAGKHVAIVGPSGAGKSTLFRLLLRLDDPQSGHIELDGTPITQLPLQTLRTQFALVAQESPLFSGTVAENVTFGAPQATEDEIWQALKIANAEAFVKTLPQQLHTRVGEKGVQLSGGQRQRLAIARAVLTNAPILLLDEATSHLDSESERAIQSALEKLGKGKTVITIAHRLSTVKAADEILVFDHGHLAAQGTHAQLLKSSKLYNALATLQLQA